MNIVLDILFAFILVGMLILSAFRVDTNVKQHAINMRMHLTAQTSASTLSTIVEEDLRKIGHGLYQPTKAIALADSDRIIFAYDKNRGSIMDSTRIEYTISDNFEPPTPNKIRLERIEDGLDRQYFTLGLTRFNLAYYNQRGDLLPTPVMQDSLPSIKQIQVLMEFEGAVQINDQVNQAKYISRVTPKNMLVKYGRD